VEVKTRLVHLTFCYYSGQPSISSGKNGDQIRWKYLWRENMACCMGSKNFPCCCAPFCSDLVPT